MERASRGGGREWPQQVQKTAPNGVNQQGETKIRSSWPVDLRFAAAGFSAGMLLAEGRLGEGERVCERGREFEKVHQSEFLCLPTPQPSLTASHPHLSGLASSHIYLILRLLLNCHLPLTTFLFLNLNIMPST